MEGGRNAGEEDDARQVKVSVVHQRGDFKKVEDRKQKQQVGRGAPENEWISRPKTPDDGRDSHYNDEDDSDDNDEDDELAAIADIDIDDDDDDEKDNDDNLLVEEDETDVSTIVKPTGDDD